MAFPVIENALRTDRHTTFYLSCGAADAPVIIFVHGWPELSISWRYQLQCFAALGFRCIAPDMRGYGRSRIHPLHDDYAVEESVNDMLDLLDALGRERAVWVGHDWGAPVVWSLAGHHPERCWGVANLSVPYIPQGFAAVNLVPLVDRVVYPAAEFPAGQWDYLYYYEENFAAATAAFEANAGNTVKALFRRGTHAGKGKPARTATVRRDGGWFGGAGQAPDVPIDYDVLTDEAWHVYTAALERNGFFGPGSWYMNEARNIAYAARARDGGVLMLPVLFVHGDYDYTCDGVSSKLGEPMRSFCANLTEVVVPSGHWMAQEKPTEVNAALARWLVTRLPDVWPG